MKRIVISMHVSLDGFVAGPNGEMDWIIVDEEMFDFGSKQTEQADTALYGRVTYEMMQGYWPKAAEGPNPSKHTREHSAWYNRVDKIVLSSSMKGQGLKNTTIISTNVATEMKKVKQGPGANIIIFGSPRACHTLMYHDLIDDYHLFVNPILLGKGIPMFTSLEQTQKLKFTAAKTFSSGVICVHHVRER